MTYRNRSAMYLVSAVLFVLAGLNSDWLALACGLGAALAIQGYRSCADRADEQMSGGGQ